MTLADSGLANTVTLVGAINTGVGGVQSLNRHAAAALANADSVPPGSYAYTKAQVIAIYQNAVNIGTSAAIDTANQKFIDAQDHPCYFDSSDGDDE